MTSMTRLQQMKMAMQKHKLNDYFSPKKEYTVPLEKLDAYRLVMLAKDCEFVDVDCEIKAQLIQSRT